MNENDPRDELEARKDELAEQTTEVPAPSAAVTTTVTDADVIDPDEDGKIDDAVPAHFGDAEVNDPPLRTGLPDVPIADALGVGAGAPKTATPEGIDPATGRPLENPATAYASDEELAAFEAGPGNQAEPEGDAAPAESPLTADEQAEADLLVEGNDADELAELAERASVSKSGSKAEVAERIVRADRESG